MNDIVVKIDSIIWSFCLCHVCRNSLSYSRKETWLTLCKSDAKQSSGVADLEQNKHQLLHRLQSIRTSLIYNIMRTCLFFNGINKAHFHGGKNAENLTFLFRYARVVPFTGNGIFHKYLKIWKAEKIQIWNFLIQIFFRFYFSLTNLLAEMNRIHP